MPRKRTKQLLVRPEWCKGCNICVSFCPTHVLALDRDGKIVIVHEEACTECRLCELRCPDFAIELVPLPVDEAPEVTA
ncbi:MAG: 4Fe-4S binding protein [Myxococcota bacterium]|jgi:2-oxoglutarate ferredoxin oxidoreductase subunit delta|nr:4Fe-4S binding protein [Myxococcota bacterium]